MNTKDFVVLPWGKPGNSVKLKYKNVQELRMEKVQLELENQEMEKKLQEFRSTRSKEKEEIKSNGYHWKSGKVGKLGNQSHMMSQNNGNAIKVCVECGEDYCSGCFAKIHQKGAQKLHRTTLLQAKSQILSGVLHVAHQFIKKVNPDEPKGGDNFAKGTRKSQHKPKSLLRGSSSEVEMTAKGTECANPGGWLLCEGSFDEEASAQSFQEALSQWRTGHYKDKEKQQLQAAKPDSLEECEVQTNLKIWREPINIEFKEDSLSYMEKLWLKKYKRTPQEQLVTTQLDTSGHACEATSEAQCSQNGGDEKSEGEEIKVQQPTPFLPGEELSIERPEPSLKITELDDTYEEELEESENVVPYKVELSSADSQLSYTLDDYQNSFPYEEYIYQHYVFNKEKPDLLNHSLRNNSTYCKDDLKAGTSNTDSDNIVDADVYYADIKNIGESSCFERNLKEEYIGLESNQKSDDSCILIENKDSLSNIGLDKPSTKEKLSQKSKDSSEFSNLHERPKSALLLQDIALRSKPITEKYQGLEKSFTFDRSENLNLISSYSLECSHSSTRITLAGDREWIPEISVSGHTGTEAALGVLQSGQNLTPSGTPQTIGWESQRPSTANLPLSNSVKESSLCLSSSRPHSSSIAVLSLSRAASEILEIEYIDITGQNEPFLDNTADQQTLDSLEKELNEMRNLADPSEKLYGPTSEESPAFNNHSLSIIQISTDSPGKTSPCGVEELSSYGKDTEVRSLLAFSESSTDEEEEFLDKQHVVTLPWSKSI